MPQKSNRISVSIFILSVVILITSVWQLGSLLPERVATHFDVRGYANAWMPRHNHLLLFPLVGIALAGLCLSVVYAIRFFPRLVNIPNKAYWILPENLPTTCTRLWTYSLKIASALLLFFAYLNYQIVLANLKNPPQLNIDSSSYVFFAFIAYIILLSLALFLSFRKIPTDS